MNKIKIEKLLYKDKNYSKIKEVLKDNSDSWSFNVLGEIALYEHQIELAAEYFNKLQNLTAVGYCRFLQGKTEEALSIIAIVKGSNPQADWLFSLINIIKNIYDFHPTYMQIRNFFEQDLEMLFVCNQIDLIKKILSNCTYFEKYNKEIYKYCARVLVNNNYPDEAMTYINKSLDIYYKDPETHFIIGEIFEKKKMKNEARDAYLKSSNINGKYLPAENKLKVLSD